MVHCLLVYKELRLLIKRKWAGLVGERIPVMESTDLRVFSSYFLL